MSYRQKGMASARSPHFCLLWSAMIPKILLCQLLTFFSRTSMNVIVFELPTLLQRRLGLNLVSRSVSFRSTKTVERRRFSVEEF